MNGQIRAVLIDGDGGLISRYRRSAYARKFFQKNGLSHEQIKDIYDRLDAWCGASVNKQCHYFVKGLIQLLGGLLVCGGIVYAIVNSVSTVETAKVMGAIFGGVGMIVAGFLCIFVPSCVCEDSSRTVRSVQSTLVSLERSYPNFHFGISNSTFSIPQLRVMLKSTSSDTNNHSALPVATATAVSIPMTVVEMGSNESDPNGTPAAASAPPEPSSTTSSSRDRIASEIARLHALHISGALNQEEFERAKEKILA